MEGLFNDLWKDKDVISVDHCLDITLPVCFFDYLPCFIPDTGLCRLHFSLLELQVCAYTLPFISHSEHPCF